MSAQNMKLRELEGAFLERKLERQQEGAGFLALRGGASGPAGLLLGLNPYSVTHISSMWSKEVRQNVLVIHLSGGRRVVVYEEDAEDVLTMLGLGEFVGDWVFNLERDID
jgi:hypothetical protein